MTEDERMIVRWLERSYRHWTGKALPGPAMAEIQRLEWLHRHADFALLAHDHTDDPRFMYANAFALASFKYPASEFIGMPSRFSATDQDRPARQQLLARVEARGYADGYEGPRVDRQGALFTIRHGEVWNLNDSQGGYAGQAALFRT